MSIVRTASLVWAVAGLFVLVAGASSAHAQSWADWRQARPYLVRADFSLAGYEALLVELQQLQQDLVDRLHIAPSQEPIELYLFQSEESYRAHLQSRYPQAPQRRALFVKSTGPGQVFAYLSPEFEIDLRHETTHALLHASLRNVPLWLDEGLAEYFEVRKADRVRGNPHLRSLKWNLWLGMTPRLSALEDKHELEEMGKREYMYSWAWVHYMLHGPDEARQTLVEYLRESHTELPEESLSRRLERRLPQLEKRFVQHFTSSPRKWRG